MSEVKTNGNKKGKDITVKGRECRRGRRKKKEEEELHPNPTPKAKGGENRLSRWAKAICQQHQPRTQKWTMEGKGEQKDATFPSRG
jgi:hypothetical protein